MFAHVVTAHAQPEDLDNLTRLVREQLPGIPEQPGFRGFYFLRGPESDKLMTISLWETTEDLRASVERAAGHAAPAAALTGMQVDTYEVAISA